jgi:hypothetical protein
MENENLNKEETANSDLVAVRRSSLLSALTWWNKLTQWEKDYYDREMFGVAEWWEDRTLKDEDILKIFQNYA